MTHTVEETIRLNVPIPVSLNNRLAKIPRGLKADVVRKLMEMFADLIDKEGRAVIIALHEDKLMLRPRVDSK